MAKSNCVVDCSLPSFSQIPHFEHQMLDRLCDDLTFDSFAFHITLVLKFAVILAQPFYSLSLYILASWFNIDFVIFEYESCSSEASDMYKCWTTLFNNTIMTYQKNTYFINDATEEKLQVKSMKSHSPSKKNLIQTKTFHILITTFTQLGCFIISNALFISANGTSWVSSSWRGNSYKI